MEHALEKIVADERAIPWTFVVVVSVREEGATYLGAFAGNAYARSRLLRLDSSTALRLSDSPRMRANSRRNVFGFVRRIVLGNVPSTGSRLSTEPVAKQTNGLSPD